MGMMLSNWVIQVSEVPISHICCLFVKGPSHVLTIMPIQIKQSYN